jgi:conjugal transfer pilus assembly protein TraE
MNFSRFINQWESTKTANLVLLVSTVAMAIANMALSAQVIHAKVERELVPPMLNQQVKIGYAMADTAYYKSWALYVAELVGNLTPGNADFVAGALGRLFTSSDALSVKTEVLAQGRNLAQNSVVMFFKADEVIYDPQTGIAYVTGTQRQVSPDGSSLASQQLTYQMHIEIDAGQPVLTDLTVYDGPAHTKSWFVSHPPKAKKPATTASADSTNAQ